MDKVTVASTIREDGKITVSKINILSDIEENETTEIEFANDILKIEECEQIIDEFINNKENKFNYHQKMEYIQLDILYYH